MNNKNYIELIKELRKKTGLGILECRNILYKSNFNIKLSISKSLNYKKIKFNKFNLNKVYNGIILSGTSKNNKYGILLEINSSTDFVSKNIKFINFCNKIIKYSVDNNIIDFNNIEKKFYNLKLNLISIFNENISFGNKFIFYGDFTIYSYVHMKKIGTLIKASINSDINILKKISMHILSNKPTYISKNNIPKYIINNEYNIQFNTFESLKNKEKINKNEFINNKINNFINEKSLLNQKFIFNENINIKKLLEINNIKIFDFKIIKLKD